MLVLVIVLSGCPASRSAAPASEPETTLFERLGGLDGLRPLVDDLVGIIAADPRIQDRFRTADFRQLKSSMLLELCARSGGPCRPEPNRLREAHADRDIEPGEFEAFVEDAALAARRAQLPPEDLDEFVDLISSMESEVVAAP